MKAATECYWAKTASVKLGSDPYSEFILLSTKPNKLLYKYTRTSKYKHHSGKPRKLF